MKLQTIHAFVILMFLSFTTLAFAQDESYCFPEAETLRLRVGLGAGLQRDIFGGIEFHVPIDFGTQRNALLASVGFDPIHLTIIPSVGIAYYSKPDDYYRKWGWGFAGIIAYKKWTDGPESNKALSFSIAPTLMIRRWSKTWLLSIGPMLEERGTRIVTDDFEETRSQVLLGATAEVRMLFW